MPRLPPFSPLLSQPEWRALAAGALMFLN